jgi:hypothetical protein
VVPRLGKLSLYFGGAAEDQMLLGRKRILIGGNTKGRTPPQGYRSGEEETDPKAASRPMPKVPISRGR